MTDEAIEKTMTKTMTKTVSGNKLLQKASKLRALGPLAPRFRFGLQFARVRPGEQYFELPFKRSWVTIGVSGVFFAVFCIPYFSIAPGLAGFSGDSLFDLITTLFTFFWLMGWSVGVIILALVFFATLLGRETLHIRPGSLTLRLELLRIGVSATYYGQAMSQLRRESPDAANGSQWRGEHLAFDYAGEPIGFGSALDEAKARAIVTAVQTITIDQAQPTPIGVDKAFSAVGVNSHAYSNPGDVLENRDESLSSVSEPRSDVREFVSARQLDSPGAELVSSRVARTGSSNIKYQAVSSDQPDPEQLVTTLHSFSTRALIAANLIPLAGVLLAGWSIGDIMLLFWAESAVIGFYNLLKMWVIGRWSILFIGPFFTGHYGAFMAGHLLFIYGFFQSGMEGGDPGIAEVMGDFIGLWPALLGLVISHGVSYRQNFLGRREYEGRTINEQMGEPYKRIIIMHVTIIFGGFLVMAFDAPVLALILLLLLKITVDTRAHLGEHRRSRHAGS